MKKVIVALLLALLLCSFGCGGAGSSSSPSGENPGKPSGVQLLPSHYYAQTNSTIIFHAKVLDGNGSPVKNTPVIFSKLSSTGVFLNERDVPLGDPTVRTNNNGIATVKLKSTVQGFSTVMAETNKGSGVVRDSKTVYFAASTNLQPFIILDVDVDGDGVYNESDDFKLFNPSNTQATIRATVFNKFGQRASGSVVYFGADSSEASFPLGSAKTTDANGQASVLVQVSPSIIRNIVTVLNITASADNGAAGMVSLFLQPVTVNNVSVSANPSVVAPDGTSSVLAVVSLSTGTPAPSGSTVSFIASCGTVTPFAQTVSGAATATFKASSTPDTCTITASIGGKSGTTHVVVTTDLTVQPEDQTGSAGGTATYRIFGGVAPYTVTSSNPAVAYNSSAGNGFWNVSSSGATFAVQISPAAPEGSVDLTIRDAVGTTVTATLTVGGAGSTTTLSVLPSALTLDGSAASDPKFGIFGGVPPYSIYSSDNSLKPDPDVVSSSPYEFEVHVTAGTPAKTVTYTIVDSAHATTTATLTVTAPISASLLIVPGSVTADSATGGTFDFTVSGGTPGAAGYYITSTDPTNAYDSGVGDGIWNVPSSGGTFTVTVPAGAPTETVTLNVFDSVGGTKSATIDIIGGGGPISGALNVTPASISLTGLSGTSDNVTFTITGGTPGYAMFSSNTAVIPNALVSGSSPYTFTIDPQPVSSSTAVTITVVDSVGSTKTATVTVTPATSSLAVNPSSLAVFTGTTGIQFRIIGGKPDFTVYSSDTTIATIGSGCSNAGGPCVFSGDVFNVDAVGAGSATITIVDSDGQTVTSTLTVNAPTPPTPATLVVSPPSATFGCTAGGSTNFVVTGGSGPNYTVTSSNPNVIITGSPVTSDGGSFAATVNPASCGLFPVTTTVPIIVTDSASNVTSVTLTVNNP